MKMTELYSKAREGLNHIKTTDYTIRDIKTAIHKKHCFCLNCGLPVKKLSAPYVRIPAATGYNSACAVVIREYECECGYSGTQTCAI